MAADKVIYLDNNATTMVAPEVYEAMAPYFSELYGNPSSMHSFGGQVGVAVDRARQQVASLLGCDVAELVFTSCGTESDSTAILSALKANPDKRHVITTRVRCLDRKGPYLRQCSHKLPGCRLRDGCRRRRDTAL